MAHIKSQPPESLAMKLSEQIRHRIQSAGYQDGDFFLTEADLAEEYNVSRRITREAVNRLCALGILEGRKRKGLLVRHPDPVGIWANCLPSLAGSEEKQAELAQFRYALEVGAVELAVRNASDEQIEHLSQLAKEFKQVAEAGVDRKLRTNLERQFHGLILEMSGASLISDTQKLLSVQLQNYSAKSGAEPTAEEDNRIIWQHFELVSAIKDRDVERARSVMRSHLKGLLAPEQNTP